MPIDPTVAERLPADDSERIGAFEPYRSTRRRLLQGTAAATSIGGLGGLPVVTAQDGDDGEGEGEGADAASGDALDPAETIVLDGFTAGWEGLEPEAIAGTTNPTLTLIPGETYDLTWTNADGLPHNIAFLDAEESVVQRTEIIDEEGAEQSVSVTASEELATYLCEVHPSSMVGSIAFGDAGEEPAQPDAEPLVPQGPEVGLQQVAGDPISQPVGMEAVTVDDAEEFFVVDQTGEIYHLAEDGPTEFLDISPRIVMDNDGFDERGLLGLAFHPNYQENGRFFVRYSGWPRGGEALPDDFDHLFVLAEFQASEDDSLAADPASERRLLTIAEPQFNHNGGDVAFGPDGFLYVSVGDGGGADDTGVGHVEDWYDANGGGGNGQDVTDNLLGSILRIDVDAEDGDQPYGVPEDNPFVGTDGMDEIYAYGFRNPWRFSFDVSAGEEGEEEGDEEMGWAWGTADSGSDGGSDGEWDLIVADVGQNLWEEIDRVELGGNYGWNVFESFHCFSTESPSDPQAITDCPTAEPDSAPYDGSPLLDPVLEYPHQVGNQVIGISVTGGYVYRGDALGDLDGQYVFGDWSAGFEQPNGRLWVADLPAQGEAEGFDVPVTEDAEFPMEELQIAGSEDGNLNRTVLAFGRDQAGELYVLTSQTPTIDGTGEVFKIVPPEEGEEIPPLEREGSE